MRMRTSHAAAGLLRALIARSGVNRILVTEVHSTDWLRIAGFDLSEVAKRMCADLADCEFSIGSRSWPISRLPEHRDGRLTALPSSSSKR